MTTNAVSFFRQNKNIIRLFVLTALILLMPLLAMQFTREVNWSAADFIIAAVLLLGAGLSYELAVRKVRKPLQRFIVGVVIAVIILLIWAELAVGLFGTPFAR